MHRGKLLISFPCRNIITFRIVSSVYGFRYRVEIYGIPLFSIMNKIKFKSWKIKQRPRVEMCESSRKYCKLSDFRATVSSE